MYTWKVPSPVACMYWTRVLPRLWSFNSGHTCQCTYHCDCVKNLAPVYIYNTLGFSWECFAHENFSSYLGLADLLGLKLSTMLGHITLVLQYNTDVNTVLLPIRWYPLPRLSKNGFTSRKKQKRSSLLWLQSFSSPVMFSSQDYSSSTESLPPI